MRDNIRIPLCNTVRYEAVDGIDLMSSLMFLRNVGHDAPRKDMGRSGFLSSSSRRADQERRRCAGK
jgi:hypothetical protein